MHAMPQLTRKENDSLGERHLPAHAPFSEKCVTGLDANRKHFLDRPMPSSSLATDVGLQPGDGEVLEWVTRNNAKNRLLMGLAREAGSISRAEFMDALVQSTQYVEAS